MAEQTQAGNTVPPQLEALLHSLSDKIDRIQQSHGDTIALSHLEDRIVMLVERLDASDSRLGHLEAIERGLADLLVHIEEMRAARQDTPAGDSSAVESLKYDMARTEGALKYELARAQDTLDAVHGTLDLVVDRLALIERDMRSERQAAPPAAPAAAEYEPHEPTHSLGRLERLVSDSPEVAPAAAKPAPPPEMRMPVFTPAAPMPAPGRRAHAGAEPAVRMPAPEPAMSSPAPEPPMAAPSAPMPAARPQPQPAPQPAPAPRVCCRARSERSIPTCRTISRSSPAPDRRSFAPTRPRALPPRKPPSAARGRRSQRPPASPISSPPPAAPPRPRCRSRKQRARAPPSRRKPNRAAACRRCATR